MSHTRRQQYGTTFTQSARRRIAAARRRADKQDARDEYALAYGADDLAMSDAASPPAMHTMRDAMRALDAQDAQGAA